MAIPTNEANTPIRTIKYAVIGYGASGGQFVADLALQRLMLNLLDPGIISSAKYNLEVTVYSSQGEREDGAGDAWGPTHDGCINSAIPGHWHPAINPEKYHAQAITSNHDSFIQRVTKLNEEVARTALESFDELRDRLQQVNQPGAALLLARREGDRFITDLPCVPRSLLGQVRSKSLQDIVRHANQEIDGLHIDVQHGKLAKIHNIQDPLKPQVEVRDVNSGPDSHGELVEFDKVISFSGARREARLPEGWNEYQRGSVYTGLPNAQSVAEYLQKRGVSPEHNTIGFAGAQLSFIDLITLVATKLGAFDFAAHEGHGRARCTAKLARDIPYRFVVFTTGETGSVKPRLSFGMDWPGTPEGFVHPVSYLQTEHLLALRTQKGYQWLDIVRTLWKSMIAYRMGILPSEYPRHADMMDEWVAYYEDCERFRRGEPTYCGLERTLINAAAHGYGAESSVDSAKVRMEEQFPDIFISGERMIASLFAHVSIISRLEEDGSNKAAIKILEDWYRTYSSSPVNICQPVFQLAVNGVMKHRVGDARRTTCPEHPNQDNQGKITIDQSPYRVDAFFPPTPFSTGIDQVISGILPRGPRAQPSPNPSDIHLKLQAPGIPVWHANGQLEDAKDRLVNVWDCGNNRGSNLNYTHANGDTSIVKPRLAVHLLSSSHEFAPPLAACMLAHDAYVIQGKEDPSQILQTEISNSQPSREGFSQQMILLEEHYEEIMQRYEYVKAIQAPCLRDQWRSYFERGQTPASRAEVVKELANSGDRVKSNVADAYCQATSDRMRPARNPLSYDEWHNAFTDQEMMTAWNILLKANSIN
ncbi:hypothetical protein BN14_08286 [Rhizoctonia solani AG-1 IB]|nr:hypothetical protein BN14_08286 [Rhizoctonia solani AG-1 IB]